MASLFSTAQASGYVSVVSKDYDYLLKVVLIGDTGTGKSSLMQQYSNKAYDESYISTIGVDFEIKTVPINEKVVKMQIWDTAGQERFHNITTSYYRGAHCIVLVYDITRRGSFTAIPRWLEDIRKYGSDEVEILLIGNKSDLSPSKRQVTEDEGREMASTFGMTWIEASAKTANNVDQAFYSIGKQGLEKRIQLQGRYDKPYSHSSEVVDMNSGGRSIFSCCTIL